MIAAMPAAVAAAVGFPGVGVGIALPIVGIGVHAARMSMDPAGLTFESTGLRVHGRHARFLIVWAAITDVEVTGPSHHPSTKIHVTSAAQVVATVEPDTPKNRRRVEALMAMGGDGALSFSVWTAGLDSVALARAIRESCDARPAQVN